MAAPRTAMARGAAKAAQFASGLGTMQVPLQSHADVPRPAADKAEVRSTHHESSRSGHRVVRSWLFRAIRHSLPRFSHFQQLRRRSVPKNPSIRQHQEARNAVFTHAGANGAVRIVSRRVRRRWWWRRQLRTDERRGRPIGHRIRRFESHLQWLQREPERRRGVQRVRSGTSRQQSSALRRCSRAACRRRQRGGVGRSRLHDTQQRRDGAAHRFGRQTGWRPDHDQG